MGLSWLRVAVTIKGVPLFCLHDDCMPTLTPTAIDDVLLVTPSRFEDDRGFFSTVRNDDELKEAGLNTTWVQGNLSHNIRAGTLRGLHYQSAPHGEVKLVRCVKGAIWDVAVDVRPSSPTFKQWVGVELNEENREQLYIPEGFAHGFITLCNDTDVHYDISYRYMPEAARSLQWNDPALAIKWPVPPVVLSEKDANANLLSDLLPELMRAPLPGGASA